VEHGSISSCSLGRNLVFYKNIQRRHSSQTILKKKKGKDKNKTWFKGLKCLFGFVLFFFFDIWKKTKVSSNNTECTKLPKKYSMTRN